jgi:hypothetical protein
MGFAGKEDKYKVFYKQSQRAIEPEVFTKNAMGSEKG